MDHSNDTDGIGAAFAFLAAAPFVIAIVFWIVCAVIASSVAPEDRRWTFVGITFFFLGPLGVAAAAIAQPRKAVEPDPPAVHEGTPPVHLRPMPRPQRYS